MKTLVMDVEQFVRWALDSSRTLEELYTTELVVEQAFNFLRARGLDPHISLDEIMARQRQRNLNPAYKPVFTEENLRRAAEAFPSVRNIHWYPGYNERQIRDLQAIRFLPALESFSLHNSEVTDLNPLADLPGLRKLLFGGTICDDYTPLSRCAQLTDLSLTFAVHWPDLAGLEKLSEIEKLSLKGNLLAFKRGLIWPKVKVGTLECTPLAARNLHDLPQLPACEILTLGGVERLDGIEAFPHVLNLTLTGKVRDFTPLQALKEMTCFTCNAAEPLDVSPLTRLPKLYFLAFETKHNFGIDKGRPRDFSTLVEAPQLRELQVKGCPPVDTEVAALNAGLPPWDDLFLAPKARPPLPPLRVVIAPMLKINERSRKNIEAAQGGPMDLGLRKCEAQWVARFVARALNKQLGCRDWGTTEGYGEQRSVGVTIESFSVVDKLSPILEATRSALAKIGPDYTATVWINLKSPKRKRTKAEKQLEEQFEREQDDAEFERSQQEQQEYLDRLHRYELKKQDGTEIKPEEFAAPAAKALPPAPWEREEEDEDDEFGSGVAVKKKPEPPPSLFDDDGHPLADNYRTMAHLDLSEAWFNNRDEGLVSYLLGRTPDEVISETEPAQ
ncbi:MAG: hypothetical protein H0X66_07055 [Verrucomicrobia bacterium]|nr:hypothetical protein [Verrucomicrobiota bacterium]